ncbi:MAG: glycosyltransferase family A protein [Lachnospiraceae bacterium]|nr:glycosyltransferase family A protein [Lachnospiraceae bacterium]
MKEITFAVPCYNSQDYIKRCVDSLLCCGSDGEIIIIDDGSTDATGEIADAYAARYPEIVKVVHKENGGHGSGVNAGLKAASGRFFKVVDSDDWLDRAALEKLMCRLRKWQDGVDLLICNYVYDHLYENRQKSVSFENVFPEEQLCGWQDMGRFKASQYLVMHALVFRTEVLRKSGIKLPEHTFYVDNLFAYKPLPYVKNILYLDVDLYHYFLGRDDQSVNEESYKKRIDQQILVTKLVVDCVDLQEVKEKSPKLSRYMMRNISIMLSISSVYLLMIKTEEALQKRRVLWAYIKEKDRGLYRRLRYTSLGGLTFLPGKIGGWLTLKGYERAKRTYEFS